MRTRLVTRGLGLAGILAALLPAAQSGAVSPYLSVFNDLYGTAGTRLDTCGTCHVSFNNDSAGRNPFGAAFEGIRGHAADPAGALIALQDSDPDGDASLSIAEINALFMPGWSCDNVAQAVNAPPDLVAFADPANPGCGVVPETSCFDGVDGDADGLTDCADPDCEGLEGGACDSGLEGVCAAGTLACSNGAEACFADLQPLPEGPVGDPSCSDSLDGDCDGLTDQADPDCQSVTEVACWDGLDGDADGLVDCADPDCQGSSVGSCDTGEPGVCADGTLACSQGVAACTADLSPQTEGPFGSASCSDGLDNDCDGTLDSLDADCQGASQPADVYALKLSAPKRLHLRGARSVSRRIALTVEGDTIAQETTAALFHEPLQAVAVAVDPASATRLVQPGGGATRFLFDVEIACTEPGSWLVEWTATVDAAENRNPLGDFVTATTSIDCR